MFIYVNQLDAVLGTLPSMQKGIGLKVRVSYRAEYLPPPTWEEELHYITICCTIYEIYDRRCCASDMY